MVPSLTTGEAVLKAAIAPAPHKCPRSLTLGYGIATIELKCSDGTEDHTVHSTEVNDIKITWQDIPEPPPDDSGTEPTVQTRIIKDSPQA